MQCGELLHVSIADSWLNEQPGALRVAGKNLKPFIRFAAIVPAVALFGWLLSRSLQDLDFGSIAWHPVALLLAIAFVQCGMLVNVLLMKFVFQFLGAPIPFKDAYNVYFVSNLGRYIPGKVWQLLALTHMAKRRGIKPLDGATLFVINQLLVILGGFLFVLVIGVALSDLGEVAATMSLLPVIPLFILLIYPASLVRLANFCLRLIRRQPIEYDLTRRYAFSVVTFVIFSYSFTGVGFVWLARGVGLEISDLFFMIAVFPLAYLLGYLAFIAPGGVGIRESFLILLLGYHYSDQMSALLALAAFIWFISVEFINSIIALANIKYTVVGPDD